MRARALLFLLVPVAVAVGYGPAARNDLVWDDRIHILENPAVREARWLEIATRPIGSYYRPVVFASFALEAAAVGAAPPVLHTTNLVLHAFAAGLLLAAALALGAGHRAALAGSLLFALHPVQSEAVLYVSGRTDVLAGVFALGALLLHGQAAGWRDASPPRGARFGAALCFALALGCKESAAVVPLAFAYGDRLFSGSRRRSLRAVLLGVWPYLLVLALYLGWRASLPGEGLVLAGLDDAPARVTAALAALADYAGLLILPVGLHLERFVSAEPAWRALVGLLLLLAALACAWRAAPMLRFWMAWAALAYLPTSNLVPVYPGLPAGVVFAPEHFLYLPSMGLLMAFALAAAKRLGPRPAVGALAAILAVYAVLLHDRARDWRDEETLYRHTLSFAPESARVRLNLGNLLLARGETQPAAVEFEAGLVHHPEDPDLLTNAGIAWMSLGRYGQALRALRRVVSLEPGDAQAWANLAAVYGSTRRWAEAREAYVKALTLDSANPDARAGLRMLEAFTPDRGPVAE
jgi:tetratricopeptide (TPR) repeat protein